MNERERERTQLESADDLDSETSGSFEVQDDMCAPMLVCTIAGQRAKIRLFASAVLEILRTTTAATRKARPMSLRIGQKRRRQ